MFANNKILFVAILVIVLAGIGGLILLASRTVFGRRISTGANGRSRQPRLGIVDAFDLDRQRQLVIVRRDNVEHLLMIGGPNDLVIETAIVRAAAAVPTAQRDKDASPPAVLPPIAGVVPVPPSTTNVAIPPAFPELGKSFGEEVDGDGLLHPEVPSPELLAANPGQAPTRPAPTVQTTPRAAPPVPQRPGAALPGSGTRPTFPPPRPASIPVAPRPLTTPSRPASNPIAVPRAPAEAKRVENAPQPAVQVPDERTPSEPIPLVPPSADAAPAAPKPPISALRPPRPEPPRVESAAKPVPPPSRPSPVAAPVVPANKSLDALESLEEEMAKLLGRPIPPADKT